MMNEIDISEEAVARLATEYARTYPKNKVAATLRALRARLTEVEGALTTLGSACDKLRINASIDWRAENDRALAAEARATEAEERFKRACEEAERRIFAFQACTTAAEGRATAAERIMKEIVSQCDQGGTDGKVFARDSCIQEARKLIENK